MERFILQTEDPMICGEYNDVSRHETWDAAEAAIGVLFDGGEPGDFRIVDTESNYKMRFHGYRFVKQECPICGKEVRVREMERTYDCHGIPYRLVCGSCYDRVMSDRGFDGEMYSEADEEFGEDY